MGKRYAAREREAIKRVVDAGMDQVVPDENTITFHSWDEMLAGFKRAGALEAGPSGRTVAEVQAIRVRNYASDGWHGKGVRTYADIERLASEGLPEDGRRAVESAQERVRHVTRAYQANRITYGYTGSTLDVSAYMAGNPECVLGEQMMPSTQGKVVCLVVDMIASGSVKGSELQAHGQRVLELALAIDAVGLQSEIWLGARSSRGKGYLIKVCVKRAGDYLDPAVIAYALSHPSMFRGVGFTLTHLTPRKNWEDLAVGFTYGRVADLRSSDFPEGAVMIPRAENCYGDIVKVTLDDVLGVGWDS